MSPQNLGPRNNFEQFFHRETLMIYFSSFGASDSQHQGQNHNSKTYNSYMFFCPACQSRLSFHVFCLRGPSPSLCLVSAAKTATIRGLSCRGSKTSRVRRIRRRRLFVWRKRGLHHQIDNPEPPLQVLDVIILDLWTVRFVR